MNSEPATAFVVAVSIRCAKVSADALENDGTLITVTRKRRPARPYMRRDGRKCVGRHKAKLDCGVALYIPGISDRVAFSARCAAGSEMQN